jgi:hypothetical protein
MEPFFMENQSGLVELWEKFVLISMTGYQEVPILLHYGQLMATNVIL